MNFYIFAENLLVHESLHLIMALILSLFIYRKYHSKKLVLLVLMVSFLIDIDHLTEGFILYGFNLGEYFPIKGGYFSQSGYMTLFLHDWELLPIILLLGKKLNRWSLGVTVAVSLAGHLLVDQLVYTGLYGMSLLQYSFIYRAIHHFSFVKLCGGCV